MDPDFPYHVRVPLASRHLMDEAASRQRHELMEWFLRTGIEEADMDSRYDESTRNNGYGHYKFMIFAFRDPQKAMLFKLAWGDNQDQIGV